MIGVGRGRSQMIGGDGRQRRRPYTEVARQGIPRVHAEAHWTAAMRHGVKPAPRDVRVSHVLRIDKYVAPKHSHGCGDSGPSRRDNTHTYADCMRQERTLRNFVLARTASARSTDFFFFSLLSNSKRDMVDALVLAIHGWPGVVWSKRSSRSIVVPNHMSR